ncbi:hypothetical protein OS493_031771 [Desmophyllum pertusum]|uniref:DUF6589 domain-containing protein n=1 Tax=Desmophyllum pertusum TaxID=174260 RepID=A0A9W9Z872_9CNID|nr:hypothetical protein OS493_031771 [Desmophyllum pertusum]
MVMLPLFSQLQKRNYWTEAFVHLTNITAAWPLATRKILQSNCSVNVKGRKGHNIALDEWVETYLVQPLKNYASGHSSVNILKLLTVNLEAIGAVREAFGGHETFNVHPTTRHTEQDPFPDQLKGMWFCLKQKFFQPSEDQNFIPRLTNQGEEKGKVSMTLVDVYKQGKEKVTQNFGQKLFNTFHVLSDGGTVSDEPVAEENQD